MLIETCQINLTIEIELCRFSLYIHTNKGGVGGTPKISLIGIRGLMPNRPHKSEIAFVLYYIQLQSNNIGFYFCNMSIGSEWLRILFLQLRSQLQKRTYQI